MKTIIPALPDFWVLSGSRLRKSGWTPNNIPTAIIGAVIAWEIEDGHPPRPIIQSGVCTYGDGEDGNIAVMDPSGRIWDRGKLLYHIRQTAER